MHDQRSRPAVPHSVGRAPNPTDDAFQFALLARVLALHPAQLSTAELARELSETPEDPGERDQFQLTLRELIGAGLLRLNGASVLPTWAALRFEQLANA